jgi:hypothetical protein
MQCNENNRQHIRDTVKHVYQPDECIVEDASDEEDEDKNVTVTSYPDFTPIEMFPASNSTYAKPNYLHQPDECIVEDASDEEDDNDGSSVSSHPDFTPIEMFPTTDKAYSGKLVQDDNVSVQTTSSRTLNVDNEQVLEEAIMNEYRKPSIIHQKKRGRPKSAHTYNKTSKLKLKPF